MRSRIRSQSVYLPSALPRLLLAAALLLSARAAHAAWMEAYPPEYPTTVYSVQGCVPECAGGCSYWEYENGNNCGLSTCACCGCESYSAALGTWYTSGATCWPNSGGGCEGCIGGDRSWQGTYTGDTARTTSC
jgi:hypothetical protein